MWKRPDLLLYLVSLRKACFGRLGKPAGVERKEKQSGSGKAEKKAFAPKEKQKLKQVILLRSVLILRTMVSAVEA